MFCKNILFLLLPCLIATSQVEAQRPLALIGTRSKLIEQNRVANENDLVRMENVKTILDLVRLRQLVPIPLKGRGYYIDPELGRGFEHRAVLFFARPWVKEFLDREAGHFRDEFPGSSLKVTSLIRTIDYQAYLINKGNPNAARCHEPLTCSPHLTGSTLDVSKKIMSTREINWMRNHLVAIEHCGWVLAIEEMVTNSFHIFVRPNFAEEDKSC